MPLPQNAQAIYQFLTGAGYSANAAAGIVGNIEQESGGNPEEQGGGLIQILGQAGGDLAEQLKAIITYNNQQGSSLIAQLNAQTSPTAAALFYSNEFERPNAALANNANREQSAEAVATAAKTGNWSSAPSSVPDASGGGLSDLLGIPSQITGAFGDLDSFLKKLMWITTPSSWVRIGSFFIAMILLAFGAYAMLHVGSDQPLIRMPTAVPVPI